jgi:hypothetical protein
MVLPKCWFNRFGVARSTGTNDAAVGQKARKGNAAFKSGRPKIFRFGLSRITYCYNYIFYLNPYAVHS